MSAVNLPVCPCCRGRTCFQCSAPFGYFYAFQKVISVCISHILLSRFFFFRYSAIGQVLCLSTPFGSFFCHPLQLWMINFVFFFVNNIFPGLSAFFFISFDSSVTFVSNDLWLTWRNTCPNHFYRPTHATYASAVLFCLSASLSVCHMRDLWQNQAMHCGDFENAWITKITLNKSRNCIL